MPYVQRPNPTAADPRLFAGYVPAYLDHLRARNYAAQTVEYKRMAIERFVGWCAERGITRVTEVTRPVLMRYQRHLYHSVARTGQPLSAAGQANRLAAVRGFFKFLTRENVLLYNPASELELPKLEKRLPKDILSADEAERVLSQPDVDTPLGIRDRAILEVLYSTGMRRQELIELQRQHLDHERGIVAIRQGKGKKDRFIPIGERALAWIAKYLADVRPELEMADVHTLFLDEAGQKLDPHRISRAVRSYVERSGVNKKGRCHLFRHTMATLMLENGADIRFIQQMLGQSMLSTTEIYTHVSILKLKQVHTLTHPAKLPEGMREALRGDATGPAGEAEASAQDVLAMLDAEAAEEDRDLDG
jgi:integrase/recombinase XerD